MQLSPNKLFQPTSLALRASAAAEQRRWASHMQRIAVLFAGVVTMAGCSAPAPKPTSEPAPNKPSWCVYKLGTLQGMINEAQRIAHAPGYALTPNRQPTRATVKYLGDVRPIGAEKRGFMELYSRTIQSRSWGDDYIREARFVEDKQEYWIPIQEAQFPSFAKEVRVGESLTLFALLLGAHIDEGTEWVLISSEFESQDVAKQWFNKLCGTN